MTSSRTRSPRRWPRSRAGSTRCWPERHPTTSACCATSSSNRTSRCTARIPMNTDDELVDHWRTGVYPYRNLMSRQGVRGAEVPPPGRAVEAPGVDQGVGPAGGRACSRAGTPRARAERSSGSWSTSTPRRPGRRTREADSGRAGPVVLPALRAASADPRRDRALRPLLVQPRRRRAGHGLLHRRRARGVPPPSARIRAQPDAQRCAPDQVLVLGEP